MEPINYNIDVASPFEAAMKGYNAGVAERLAIEKAKQQQGQQMQMQADLANVALKPNPTASDYAGLIVKYPQLSEHFKRGWDILNADQQQAKLSQSTQVYAALQSGSQDSAINLLKRQAEAYKNSGMDKEAKDADTMAEFIRLNPAAAKTAAALGLSSVMGPDKFASTFSSLEKLPGEVAEGKAKATKATYEALNTPERLALEGSQTAAQIRNLDSQIVDRAERRGLDKDRLESEVKMKLYELGQKGTQLDDGAKKLINESSVGAVAAEQSASQMLDLASKLEKQGGGYGSYSTAGEWIKKVTGNEDPMTQIRQEYIRLRNNQAIKMLPPGPATDKDIQLAMKGFPSETADSGYMASFLRGMAKMNKIGAAADNAKAEWINSVGHLGKPKTDIDIDGVKVPAGTTFADFSRSYLKDKASKIGAQQEQQQIPNRSYARWAQPGAK